MGDVGSMGALVGSMGAVRAVIDSMGAIVGSMGAMGGSMVGNRRWKMIPSGWMGRFWANQAGWKVQKAERMSAGGGDESDEAPAGPLTAKRVIK